MNIVPLDETFDLMHECFPEVDTKDLLRFRDHCIAFKEGTAGFTLLYPYNSGLFIQYIGVRTSSRRKQVATRMMNFIASIAGRPVYAEVRHGSAMYHLLKKRGWETIPITYVCPAWGNEPVDTTRVLMASNINADPMPFIRELYIEGYRNPSPELLQLYGNQLHFQEYTPELQDKFIALFSKCFDDDPATIIESIDRAKLRLAVVGGEVRAFMLYNPYPNIKSVVVEYVGVDPDCRGQRIGSALFKTLYAEYPGWAFYGECHRNTAIINLLERHGWSEAPVNWVCPAWGNIPEDTTRHLMYRNAEPKDIPAFAKAFYDYGYGVSRDDLVEKYRKEVAAL